MISRILALTLLFLVAGLSGTWQWDIDDGWQDCFDGCDCHRVYVIETTTQGDVTLIDFQEFGAPWCDFK